MAKAIRFFHKGTTMFDGSSIANGYKLFQYQAGTTTKANTYTDSGKGTANSNPMTLNADGRLDQDIYIDQSMKFTLATSAAGDPPTSSVWVIDNAVASDQVWATVAKTTDYTVVEGDRDKLIKVDASSAAVTITLLAAATAGDGFRVAIKKTDSSGNAVTADGDGSETIDGATTKAASSQYDTLFLICDGSAWHLYLPSAGDPQTFVDSNGNEIMVFSTTASAVNHIQLKNAATGNSPSISAVGDNTDVGLDIATKGAGVLKVDTTTGNIDINTTTGSFDFDSTSGGSYTFDTTTGSYTFTTTTGAFTIAGTDARTDSVDNLLVVQNQTSGTAAAGIGIGVLFNAESADEAPSNFGSINFSATDISAGSEDTDFVIQTRVAGAALSNAYKMRVTSTGNYIFTGAASAERTITFPNSDLILPTQATQAALEAETNEDTYVAPDFVKYNPGVAKVWAYVTNSGTPSLDASYNVTSITDTAVGRTTVTIGTDFSTANYAAIAASLTAAGNTSAGRVETSQAVGSYIVNVYNTSTGAAVDGNFATVCFGDQ